MSSPANTQTRATMRSRGGRSRGGRATMSSVKRSKDGGYRALEDEVEGCPLSDSALGPGPAAMAVDDAAHGGQADAHARKLALAVQALEGAEQLVGIDHVEAHPVVPDEHPRVSIHHLDADLDPRRGLLGRELERVADEVGQEDARQARIG